MTFLDLETSGVFSAHEGTYTAEARLDQGRKSEESRTGLFRDRGLR